MADRSAALSALSRSALWRGGRSSPAPFELAAVQSLELSLELLVLPFQFFALPPLLIQLLVDLLQLVFVVALGAADLLISMKNPTGGQSFQIRTPIPVRATEIGREVLKLRHD